jgi:putative pyruvate formate lyase activating enzyme
MDATRREFTAALMAPRAQWKAAYIRSEESGELARREQELKAIYSECRLCPRRCGVNRTKGEKGVCQSVARAKVYSAHPHFGEEPELVGRGGSGTIFFSNCNLLCEFCQNWEINHRGDGSFVSEDELARMMTGLQNQGCHNINLVTPTHIAPSIVGAVRRAIRLGLRVPLVYNCGGYESVDVVKLLDGIVDIYLPDFKYAESRHAEKYSSGAVGYPNHAMASIEEMHRQVGGVVTDERGVALRGLMIRHLVLPENIAGTDRFVKLVAERLGPATYVNLMAQYRPEHRAGKFPQLSRRINSREYAQAVAWARAAGLTNIRPL